MKPERVALTAVQVSVIAFISYGASHLFQGVDATIQVNGTHVYRYIAYAAIIILWYASTSKYNKYLALSLPSVLLVVAILGQQKVIDSFPTIVPFLATLIGVTTILVVPAAKGRGFAEFLVVLIVPALLAESRLGGSIMPTSEGIFTYEVSAVTVAVIGGYFYLRYVASADLRHRELLSRGASEEDTYAINRWNNFITGAIIAATTATTALLATATSILTNILQPYFAGLPLHIFLLESIVGIVIVAVIYYFKTSAGKK